jgi:hypothetical protein
METLHTMQKEQPEKFLAVRFKIIQNYGSYEGPDPLTRQLLETHLQNWANDPESFWKYPMEPFWGTSATGELVAFYMNARSGDC